MKQFALGVVLLLCALACPISAQVLQRGDHFPEGVNLATNDTHNFGAGCTDTGRMAYDIHASIVYICNGSAWSILGSASEASTLQYLIQENENRRQELLTRTSRPSLLNIIHCNEHGTYFEANSSCVCHASEELGFYGGASCADCALMYAVDAETGLCTTRDGDLDGIPDATDLCPETYDPSNADSDGDGIGNVCDNCVDVANVDQSDVDSDGFGNVCDNCPNVANADQEDADSDGIGNVCDNCAYSVLPIGSEVIYDFSPSASFAYTRGSPSFTASGGVPGFIGGNYFYFTGHSGEQAGVEIDDNLQGTWNIYARWTAEDNRSHQVSYAIEYFDQVLNVGPFSHETLGGQWNLIATVTFPLSTFPVRVLASNTAADEIVIVDGFKFTPVEGLPLTNSSNPGQEDADSDGFGDVCDICPFDADPDQLDSDGDGVGDACDTCPTISDSDQLDSDSNGVGDACDSDGDGVDDYVSDNCVGLYNPTQTDVDSDGIGDHCDICMGIAPVSTSHADSDGDSVGDECDPCPAQKNAYIPAGESECAYPSNCSEVQQFWKPVLEANSNLGMWSTLPSGSYDILVFNAGGNELLSLQKPMTASSSLSGYPPSILVDGQNYITGTGIIDDNHRWISNTALAGNIHTLDIQLYNNGDVARDFSVSNVGWSTGLYSFCSSVKPGWGCPIDHYRIHIRPAGDFGGSSWTLVREVTSNSIAQVDESFDPPLVTSEVRLEIVSVFSGTVRMVEFHVNGAELASAEPTLCSF